MENMKRVVSLLLCIVMVFGLLPMTVFATDVDTTAQVSEEETETVTGEEGIAPLAEDGYNEVTATGSATTTNTKYYYVYTTTVTAGKSYLVVNRKDAGSGNVLTNNNGSVGNTAVTVKSGNVLSDRTGNETYIELDDASKVLWAVGDGITLQNNGKYLGYTTSSGGWPVQQTTYTFGLTDTAANWTYAVKTSGTGQYSRLSISAGSTYYLRCSNGAWSWNTSTNNANVYFYELVEVSTSTTVSGTYSIGAEDLSLVVAEGHSVALKSTLTFTPDSGAATTTTDVSKTAAYDVVEGSDIVSIANGVATFTGAYGEAVVKVSYETEFGTVVNYFTITAKAPGYTLSIMNGEKDVTGKTITVKNVSNATTLNLSTLIVETGVNGNKEYTLGANDSLQWEIPEEYKNIATIDQNGKVTFTGEDGAFYITATLTVNGKDYVKGVNVSATASSFHIPTDGTTEFPEYPNEGAIRYDKTATAVGSFSQTGIAKMELSMTGVPYHTNNTLDVVLMLDRSSSMGKSDNESGTKRIASTIAAAQEFVKNVVKDEHGNFTGNRIMVLDFLGGNLKQGASHVYERNLYNIADEVIFQPNYGTGDTKLGYQVIDSDEELNTLLNNIATNFKSQTNYYGTEYAMGLRDCYEVLNAVKADGNQQFCVFMSDGIPNYYQTTTTHYDTTSGLISALYSVQNATSANAVIKRGNNYAYEKYSTDMKKAGVTVFTVGLGLYGTNSSWDSKNSKEACEMVASIMLNDISGPAGETTQPDGKGTNTLSKKDSYFFSVKDETAATDMKNVFAGIAQKIMQAATDVTVEDQITKDYTMIFDVPTGKHDIEGIDGQKFYIEFLKYTLDADHERTGTPTSLSKMYLKNSGDQYSAVNEDGSDYTKPVFTKNLVGDKGTLYYWTTDASKGDTGVSYKVGNTTYYFVSYGLPAGDNNYNMTSGGFASGAVNTTTNMSENLVLATPYFVYNAATKMLYWTVDKLDTSEYVLNYFLYLNNSATEVSEEDEKPAGSYPTNDHAYITYTNFNGNQCRQEFPKPQMTWNGAQASYVFYLVNAQGQPINKSGQVVDFANATFVTDVFTTSIIWNKGLDGESDGNAKLSVDWAANEILPDGYTIYDVNAGYELHVHETESGELAGKNRFAIEGSETGLLSYNTTKVYNTKAGVKYDVIGEYNSTMDSMKGFDFANTTVAFAVVWQPRLVEDFIVVDFGLDVLIDVVANDMLQNTVDGISWSNSAYGKVAMNSGVSGESKLSVNKQTKDGNTISIENENQIRFQQGDMEFNETATFYYESAVDFHENSTPKHGFMYSSVTVIPATTVYYEDSFVTLKSYTKQSDGTVVETAQGDEGYVWSQAGHTITATQAQDRPGAANISANLDADNVYGYDQAYDNCSTFSMGSAMKAHVDSNHYGTMEFTFYGTGFDVISMASNKTGGILIDVVDANGTRVRGMTVDTYYGYKHVAYEVTYKLNEDGEWVEVSREEITDNTNNENGDSGLLTVDETFEDLIPGGSDNTEQEETIKTVIEKVWEPVQDGDQSAIYQVPVIECAGLDYGKYTVTIKCSYGKFFNHGQYGADAAEYDFYLDAIRIYDPMGDTADITDANGNDVNVYEADKEGWPIYEEIRNSLLDEVLDGDSVAEELPGALFLDGDAGNWSISDYLNYGPNNEVYLAGKQGVTFQLSDEIFNGKIASIQIGMKSADGKPVKVDVSAATADDSANIDGSGNTTHGITTLNTATGMYYDLAELLGLQGKALEDFDYNSLQGKVITIVGLENNEGMISLTDVKVTFTEEHEIAEGLFYVNTNTISKVLEIMNAPKPEPDQGEVEEPTEPAPVFDLTNVKFDVKKIKEVKAGDPIKVEIVTDSSVEAITVDGQLITSYKAKNKPKEGTVERTWTITIQTSVQDRGEKQLTLVAYGNVKVKGEDVLAASEEMVVTYKIKEAKGTAKPGAKHK